MTPQGGRRFAAAILACLIAVVVALTTLSQGPASADSPGPHVGGGVTTDSCATCHRSHTAQGREFLESGQETALCLSCHDGTGADSNVAAEYNDANVPADDPGTATYYAHRLDLTPVHTSSKTDEFAGVLNRHAACGDCHNPHFVSIASAVPQNGGWAPSGAISNISGVSAGLAWQESINFEYELCLKCHSRYTVLLQSSVPTANMTDKATELSSSAASYHPVAAPGKNTTPAMQSSLDGGSLWQLDVTSTLRCTQCHGNYRLVGDPPVPDSPPDYARLAPHTSRYAGILIANYRSRDLKAQGEAYSAADFALCYLCHSEAPFSATGDEPRADTNFRFHSKHLTDIGGAGVAGGINDAGAGQGNAICAECHFELHSTDLAPWADNRTYSRGVNFAPNVQARPGQTAPVWDSAARTCALVCHGTDHDSIGD
jgi:predicted CXXCH cytochrome family protein